MNNNFIFTAAIRKNVVYIFFLDCQKNYMEAKIKLSSKQKIP